MIWQRLKRLRRKRPPERNEVLLELEQYRISIANGHLIPFEYPVIPRPRVWQDDENGILSILKSNDAAYDQEIRSIGRFIEPMSKIRRTGDPSQIEPYWDNDWFPPLDAMYLYSLIVSSRPSTYMEVGSGNSTKFVRQAINDFQLPTKIVSIDPCPRAEIDAICDETIRQSVETVPLEAFAKLVAGDILFVDNSHVGFQGSDVTVFFTEILPLLAKGVIWGIHDIFLPNDYPEEWKKRHYNEKYFLMSYLFGGAIRDSILFPANYLVLSNKIQPLRQIVAQRLAEPVEEDWLRGGAFWMRRTS